MLAMVGTPSTINWQAPAELFWQAERTSKRRRILAGTLGECVRLIVAQPLDRRPQYFIKVSAAWGIALKRLDYLDAQALAWRIDFPDA
jgi:hypothetical protein